MGKAMQVEVLTSQLAFQPTVEASWHSVTTGSLTRPDALSASCGYHLTKHKH